MPTALTVIRVATMAGLASLILSACGGGGGGPPPAADTSPTGDTLWAIDPNLISDGGPGPDGIPALENPEFAPVVSGEPLDPGKLVVVLEIDGRVKAYPHDILDYHEIVNDEIPENPVILTYCPLTGSAVAWKGNPEHADPTFGVSGLLYNSNLLPFDRETGSLWSQMLEVSVNGPRVLERPERMQVIETTWGTLRGMYPDALLMTRETGHSRDYDDYPYGNFREDARLLFPVQNADNRLHPKRRVIGIRANAAFSKVYQVSSFGDSTQVINDQFNEQSIVVVGNGNSNFAAIYSRELEDGTVINFSALDGELPNVMTDDEGNVWDIFGRAVSGPRAGSRLGMTDSYTSYWFAWVAHFPDAEIHFN